MESNEPRTQSDLEQLVEAINNRWPPASRHDDWSQWAYYVARMWDDVEAGIRTLRERVEFLELAFTAARNQTAHLATANEQLTERAETLEQEKRNLGLALAIQTERVGELEECVHADTLAYNRLARQNERLSAVRVAAEDYYNKRWGVDGNATARAWNALVKALTETETETETDTGAEGSVGDE